MNLQKAVYGISVVVLFFVTTAVMWKQGLKHYNSASLQERVLQFKLEGEMRL